MFQAQKKQEPFLKEKIGNCFIKIKKSAFWKILQKQNTNLRKGGN